MPSPRTGRGPGAACGYRPNMVAEPIVTRAELPALAPHIYYELSMMHAAKTALQRIPTMRSPEQNALRNAWVESFLVHARSLMDFLGDPIRAIGDDVVAAHYVSEWTKNDAEPELTRLAARLRSHVNKRVAHVTAYRVRVEPAGDPEEPDLGLALADFDAIWIRFTDRLSAEQRTWFRPTRGRA